MRFLRWFYDRFEAVFDVGVIILLIIFFIGSCALLVVGLIEIWCLSSLTNCHAR